MYSLDHYLENFFSVFSNLGFFSQISSSISLVHKCTISARRAFHNWFIYGPILKKFVTEHLHMSTNKNLTIFLETYVGFSCVPITDDNWFMLKCSAFFENGVLLLDN